LFKHPFITTLNFNNLSISKYISTFNQTKLPFFIPLKRQFPIPKTPLYRHPDKQPTPIRERVPADPPTRRPDHERPRDPSAGRHFYIRAHDERQEDAKQEPGEEVRLRCVLDTGCVGRGDIVGRRGNNRH
jgi:hypothetical protein